jgi:2-haloacid dehalogenase
MPDVFVFDAYGTLLDVGSPVRRLAGAIGPKSDALSALWRTKQLEYTWVRSLAGEYRDFEHITRDALTYSLQFLNIADDGFSDQLMEAYAAPDCYPEVKEALGTLKARGAKTAILSNGTPRMLKTATEAADIDMLLDAILSVDALGIYKTSPAAYRLATDFFGCGAPDISFQSSNRWDIAGAAAFGFKTVWINRLNMPDEYSELRPGRIVADLGELVRPRTAADANIDR